MQQALEREDLSFATDKLGGTGKVAWLLGVSLSLLVVML